MWQQGECVSFASDTDTVLFFSAASLQLLRNLDTQARAQGGAVWMINGNHESLNVAGDFRFVTHVYECVGGVDQSCTGHGHHHQVAAGHTLQDGDRRTAVVRVSRNESVRMLHCRYATEGGLLESAIMGGLRGVDAHLLPNQRAARMRLFAPGGHLAKVRTCQKKLPLVKNTCLTGSVDAI